ncbi:MAG: ImmA/IrrE family metallo-endopeptidase [Gracilibacteraceae bacterium]|nr:ImmA/IrrE family metallo-endopeptidase [Gracilibacteraceae bacterium]
MTGFIYSEVERILKKYQTRDPYDLLDAIGAVTVFSDEYRKGGLKGYSTIMNRTMYAVINAKLPSEEKKIVAGHEGGHLILHKNEMLASPVRMMRDFNIFDNSSLYEREANTFLADFLVSDDDVLAVISDEDRDYFSAARELYLPAPLFAFKLYNMMRRGYNVRSPVDLDSRFLGRVRDRW